MNFRLIFLSISMICAPVWARIDFAATGSFSTPPLQTVHSLLAHMPVTHLTRSVQVLTTKFSALPLVGKAGVCVGVAAAVSLAGLSAYWVGSRILCQGKKCLQPRDLWSDSKTNFLHPENMAYLEKYHPDQVRIIKQCPQVASCKIIPARTRPISYMYHQKDAWRCGYAAMAHALMFLREDNFTISSKQQFEEQQEVWRTKDLQAEGYRQGQWLAGNDIEKLVSKFSQKNNITVLDTFYSLPAEKIDSLRCTIEKITQDPNFSRHAFIVNTSYKGIHWVALTVERALDNTLQIACLDSLCPEAFNTQRPVLQELYNLIKNPQRKIATYCYERVKDTQRILIDALADEVQTFSAPLYQFEHYLVFDPVTKTKYYFQDKASKNEIDELLQVLADDGVEETKGDVGVFEMIKKYLGILRLPFMSNDEDSLQDMLTQQNINCTPEHIKIFMEAYYKKISVPDKLQKYMIFKFYKRVDQEKLYAECEIVRTLDEVATEINKSEQGKCGAVGYVLRVDKENNEFITPVPEYSQVVDKIKKLLTQLYQISSSEVMGWWNTHSDLLTQKLSAIQIDELSEYIKNLGSLCLSDDESPSFGPERISSDHSLSSREDLHSEVSEPLSVLPDKF